MREIHRRYLTCSCALLPTLLTTLVFLSNTKAELALGMPYKSTVLSTFTCFLYFSVYNPTFPLMPYGTIFIPES